MSRPLRYQPKEWMVHSVTTRCLQARFLLRPSPEVNALVVGILERASIETGCRLHAAAVLSSHVHLLVSSESATHLSDYMRYVNSNIAREIGRLHGWSGKFWHRRYHAALCEDEASQVERLGYVLAQGAREGLVRHARYWPGVHTWAATCGGKQLRGRWVDRTGCYDAGHRGDAAALRKFTKLCE